MVCIEEVCSWFRDLYPPKRLDLLCSLLQMCLPLELRFIGSYVEDLAKKDYYYLREAENRANDIQEVKKLTDIFDKETRGKISTYLALIHSSNTVCSNTLYSALTCILLPALDRTRLSQVDEHFVTEVILSLTMAAYHPSFSFNQRHRLLCELHNVKKLFEDHPSRVSWGCASSIYKWHGGVLTALWLVPAAYHVSPVVYQVQYQEMKIECIVSPSQERTMLLRMLSFPSYQWQ